MATYNFDSEENQYFLLSDELRGLTLALDDGAANYIYVKGQGYVEDPSLLEYVWPSSTKYSQARNMTEEEAGRFIEEIEAGKTPYEAYLAVYGEAAPIKAGRKFATWEEVEGQESPIADGMSMDEIYKALQGML